MIPEQPQDRKLRRPSQGHARTSAGGKQTTRNVNAIIMESLGIEVKRTDLTRAGERPAPASLSGATASG